MAFPSELFYALKKNYNMLNVLTRSTFQSSCLQLWKTSESSGGLIRFQMKYFIPSVPWSYKDMSWTLCAQQQIVHYMHQALSQGLDCLDVNLTLDRYLQMPLNSENCIPKRSIRFQIYLYNLNLLFLKRIPKFYLALEVYSLIPMKLIVIGVER